MECNDEVLVGSARDDRGRCSLATERDSSSLPRLLESGRWRKAKWEFSASEVEATNRPRWGTDRTSASRF